MNFRFPEEQIRKGTWDSLRIHRKLKGPKEAKSQERKENKKVSKSSELLLQQCRLVQPLFGEFCAALTMRLAVDNESTKEDIRRRQAVPRTLHYPAHYNNNAI